ncbi:hypothetical protein B0H19DRAFT_1058098 [Mycena capillaripes]|nr:hypothetical protein B0H19DRAFT_1058098 [Mycena capillaripes]
MSRVTKVPGVSLNSTVVLTIIPRKLRVLFHAPNLTTSLPAQADATPQTDTALVDEAEPRVRSTSTSLQSNFDWTGYTTSSAEAQVGSRWTPSKMVELRRLRTPIPTNSSPANIMPLLPTLHRVFASILYSSGCDVELSTERLVLDRLADKQHPNLLSGPLKVPNVNADIDVWLTEGVALTVTMKAVAGDEQVKPRLYAAVIGEIVRTSNHRISSSWLYEPKTGTLWISRGHSWFDFELSAQGAHPTKEPRSVILQMACAGMSTMAPGSEPRRPFRRLQRRFQLQKDFLHR